MTLALEIVFWGVLIVDADRLRAALALAARVPGARGMASCEPARTLGGVRCPPQSLIVATRRAGGDQREGDQRSRSTIARAAR
jgi:hypothetical protein